MSNQFDQMPAGGPTQLEEPGFSPDGLPDDYTLDLLAQRGEIHPDTAELAKKKKREVRGEGPETTLTPDVVPPPEQIGAEEAEQDIVGAADVIENTLDSGGGVTESSGATGSWEPETEIAPDPGIETSAPVQEGEPAFRDLTGGRPEEGEQNIGMPPLQDSGADALQQRGLNTRLGAIEDQQSAIETGQETRALIGADLEADLMAAENETKDRIEKTKKLFQEEAGEVDRLVDQMSDMEVDPGNFWANKSTGEKAMAGIALALGGLGGAIQASRGQEYSNPAFDVIQNAIERDIQAQEANIRAQKGKIDTANTAMETAYTRFQDATSAREAAREAAYNKYAKTVEQRLQSEAIPEQKKAELQDLRGQLLQKAGQARQSRYERQMELAGEMMKGSEKDELPSDVRQQTMGAAQSISAVDRMEEEFEGVIEGDTGLISGRWQPVARFLNQDNPDLTSLRASLRDLLIRKLAAMKGKPSDRDLAVIEEQLPFITDKPETIKRMFQNLKDEGLRTIQDNKSLTRGSYKWNLNTKPFEEMARGKGDRKNKSKTFRSASGAQ